MHQTKWYFIFVTLFRIGQLFDLGKFLIDFIMM